MRLSVVSVALTLPLLVAVMMSSGVSQEKKLALKFPVINIRKVLLGRLEVGEDYRIEVAVTNVFYTDGTSWKPRRGIRLI
jgi:hypothetical protein